MAGLPAIKPVKIAGKEFNAYYLIASVAIILMVVVSLQLHLGPTKEIKSGLKDLNLEIFKQIGAGLKVESKEDAAASIGTVAQELENARGSLNELNSELEKK